ncbi:MAG: HAD-IA family hydrolase [Verrucomicrobiae bacterium]|nr:HAD-IA family hydrolase [Verrucomicrobiae bacterium]
MAPAKIHLHPPHGLDSFLRRSFPLTLDPLSRFGYSPPMPPPPHSPLFSAVLFDLDGTLVDSVQDLTFSVNHIRHLHHLPPISTEDVRSFVGDGVRQLLSRALNTQNEQTIDRALAVYKPHYLDHCLRHTCLYPGILPLLRSLKSQGLPLGVVSNKPFSPTEKILAGLQIDHFFSAVIGGDSTPKRKPDPEPLRAAAHLLQMKTHHILVVGDSPNDIIGARRAGYASCAVLWGLGREEAIFEAKPDHVARHAHDILAAAGLG